MDPSAKHRLRAATRAARRALTADQRAEASARIVERLLTLPELRSASTVLLYAALQEEVNLGGLFAALRSQERRTLLPRVQGRELDLVAVTDLRGLELGFRGVQEPTGPAIDPGVVDVAVVPGLAFDPRGGRLGGGGGHYDRLLAGLRADAPRIGVAFTCQVVPQVPREAHDQPVTVVVTDAAVHRPGTARTR